MVQTVSDLVTQSSQYRRELTAHCYRMLGSAAEAEDAVQDALGQRFVAQLQYGETHEQGAHGLKLAVEVVVGAHIRPD